MNFGFNYLIIRILNCFMMSSEIDAIFHKIQEDAENLAPINAKMKLVMGEYIFLIDGTGERNVISQENIEADCTIRTNVDTLLIMKRGYSDPVTELMEGNIDIDGDMGLAFKLKSLISY
jgi:putative sterol carrier protein